MLKLSSKTAGGQNLSSPSPEGMLGGKYARLLPESLTTGAGRIKCIVAGFGIGFAGDQIAQRLEPGEEGAAAAPGSATAAAAAAAAAAAPPSEMGALLDWRRSAAWGVCLAGLNGIVIRQWYFALERRFGSALLPKIACDQIFMAPFATVLCLGFSGMMQEQNMAERGGKGKEWSLAQRVKNDLPTIWCAAVAAAAALPPPLLLPPSLLLLCSRTSAV